MSKTLDALCDEIALEGFCFVPAREAEPLLGGVDASWQLFADSWNGMPLDTYMADGGRYRRRRYATLSMAANSNVAQLEPHQPHYQSTDYNALNGGVARHYEPIADSVIGGPVMTSLFALCADVFNRLSPDTPWHIEVHQFRIEALPNQHGLPTPEGVHRDGVDYVMVMMVKRHNIAEGTTTIHAPDARQLASFTLTEPLDMTLVDDHRCLHGVTPVVPIDAAKPAYRDVLVITFRNRSGT
ncbi:MAG: 2OG-Fe dioxygenase family protein [Betaproteobacteria bacterium]|nr:2OG-Fe dioxygenase family protein [Betaproteobacteria bacterium]